MFLKQYIAVLAILASFSIAVVPVNAGGPVDCGECSADIVANNAVDLFDLLELIDNWGTNGPGADIAAPKDTVNLLDLLALIDSWGVCGFDYGAQYPDAEAHQIALELATGLIAAEADYDRIVRDLQLIRDAYPALADQFHSMAWAPNKLLVAVAQAQPDDDYQCLNGYYGVTNEQLLFSSGGNDWYVITLPARINVEALAVEYAQLAEVSFAEPDAIIGGANFWIPTKLLSGNWQWDIDDGWHDCFDGCDCHHTYVIETNDAGDVILIDEQTFGQSWCEFPK